MTMNVTAQPGGSYGMPVMSTMTVCVWWTYRWCCRRMLCQPTVSCRWNFISDDLDVQMLLPSARTRLERHQSMSRMSPAVLR